jgi:dimethylhistidine N-methyltransferase
MTGYAISRLLPEANGNGLAREVIDALRARPRRLSPKWLYDARGSALFEAITRQPEYYPTRTELAILEGEGEAIAGWVGSGPVTVEYGAGSGEKARRLLNAIDAPSAYVCVEIEAGAAQATAAAVAAGVPGLPVEARVGDFTALEAGVPPLPEGPRLGFFPGSTLGNFDPEEARDLLTRFHRHLGAGSRLLLGLDRTKSLEHLLPAYDDAAGVTAAFNLNLLARINRELDADFDLARFEHDARWNAEHERIEMHLVSRDRQQVHVLGQAFSFDAGESLHTECSYKYSDERVEELLEGSGWREARRFTDQRGFFMVLGLEAA